MEEKEIHHNSNNIILHNVIDNLKKIINDLKISKNLEITINEINNIIQNLDLIVKTNESSNINLLKTETYENGDKYIGQTKNEKAEGKGIYIFKNGDKYEGEFKDDKRDGKGVYISVNGCKYDGEYKNDKRDGKGIMFYEDGNYEGEFKNDKKDGKGIYYYKNGDREMGDYSNGKKIGKHIILKNDGSTQIKEYK